jgi:hypothetical protein
MSTKSQKRTFGAARKSLKAGPRDGCLNLMSNLRSAHRDQKCIFQGHLREAETMWILTVYILIVVIMELIVVAIGLALDRLYPSLSLTVSLSLFFAVLWLAWVVAVRVTEPQHAESKGHTD